LTSRALLLQRVENGWCVTPVSYEGRFIAEGMVAPNVKVARSSEELVGIVMEWAKASAT